MAKKLKHLETAIAELNAPTEIEGEEFKSNFDFVLEPQEEKGVYHLYDRNECYHLYYAEDAYWLMVDCASEFGFDPPTEMHDKVMEKLEDALRKDVGNANAYIDWYDNVRMCFTTEW